jgi:hypothetical protein
MQPMALLPQYAIIFKKERLQQGRNFRVGKALYPQTPIGGYDQ